MSKARGWLLVGTGGLLIASQETWLVEGHEWPTELFWVLVFGMAGICVAYTVLQAMREIGVATKRTELRSADSDPAQ